MTKNPFHFGLRDARRSRQLTQASLANAARLSIPTIRALERGGGSLSNFNRAVAAMGAVLDGRNLPPGYAIGSRLKALRLRRGISVRELAGLSRVSAPTIAAIEAGSGGHMRSIAAMAAALGAGLAVRPRDAPQAFYASVGNATAHHAWTTPPELLDSLYRVLSFDLDPCSPTADKRRAPVKARTRFIAEDDGLSLPWFGAVFVNPPYGRTLPKWIAKCRAEYERRRVQCVVALVPARTDTKWWHDHIAGSADVFMLRGRLKFGDGEGAAPFPSALAVWGASPDQINHLRAGLGAWHVPALAKAS